MMNSGLQHEHSHVLGLHCMSETERVECSWLLVGNVVWRELEVCFGRLKLGAGIRRCAIPSTES